MLKLYCKIGEYYYIHNAQGDINGLFDSTGTQVVTYTYDTWGKLISVTGTLASTVGVKNPYRYRGYRYDTETGYYYCNSRYYVPEWGRWLNADSTEVLNNLTHTEDDLIDVNLFAYCLNNPINMEDPDGHFAWALGALYFVPGVGQALLAATLVVVAVVVTVAVVDKGISYYKEHISNKSPSKRNDHENGQARKKKDDGGEKGDARRKPNPNKRKP